MFKYILILFFLHFSIKQYAQNGYDWEAPFFISSNLGGDSRAEGVMDASGNMYLICLFEDNVVVGDTTLYSSKDDGVFIAKWDIDHNLLWTKVVAEAKRSNELQRRVLAHIDIKIDNENFVYPMITYADTAYIFDVEYIVDKSLVIYKDVAILKLSSEGVLDKIHHIKGSCSNFISELVINNGLYFSLANSRSDNDVLDSCSCIINGDTTIYPLSSNGNGFIGRMNENTGAVEWIEKVNAEHRGASPLHMEIIDSNLYIVGGTHSSFDLIYKQDTMQVPGSLSKYIFLMKIDLEGNFDWSTFFGIKGWDSFIDPLELVVNTKNDILVTANHSSQNTLNQVFFPNSSSLVGAGINDRSFILLNYDSLGNIKWKDMSNSIGYEGTVGLAVDSSHDIYLSGYFNDKLIFGNDTIIPNGTDMLITSYSQNGLKKWFELVGGNGSQVGGSIFIDEYQDIHIWGGASTGSMNLGSLTVDVLEDNPYFYAKMSKHPLNVTDYTPTQFDVNISPNPSRGSFTIRLKDEMFSSIKIYTSNGELLRQQAFSEYESTCNIADLTSGLYFLEIQSKSGKKVISKVVIE